MIEREFLGWDQPFVRLAAGWLLDRRHELPDLLVLTPTSQGGRRLVQYMTESAGALLLPRMTTPGALLRTTDPAVAADWTERLAWMETLEQVGDWSQFRGLFPEAPGGGARWSAGLARDLVRLRHSLQENGHTLSSAAKFLTQSPEAGRWEDMASLEATMERHLRTWGYKSRSRVLAAGVPLPPGIRGIILAGVTEMPPLVERAIQEWDGSVRVLVAAPPEEAENFSSSGRPLGSWSERVLPWPEGERGSVTLTTDARQQAAAALQVVAAAQSPSDDVALGTADEELGDLIAAEFTAAGWTAYHPAGTVPPTGICRWMRPWMSWLEKPTLAVFAELLILPETGRLIRGDRAAHAECLSGLRDQWVANEPDDLHQRMKDARFHHDGQAIAARMLLSAIQELESLRAGFSSQGMRRAMERLLDALAPESGAHAEEAAACKSWLLDASGMIEKTNHPPNFWVGLMLEEMPPAAPPVPEGRVIDAQGWLELLLEPGSHLVLCGMNEGKVPGRQAADPWLGEAAARTLGLNDNTGRAARDAFLYQSMLESRRHRGRVDLICAKTGPGGDPMLPSRLLLAADPGDLPGRVRFLFRDLPPPESGLRWHADWKWAPRGVETPASLAVTSLATYLACPFRFYLKHCLRMQAPDTGRVEWNRRDFGNVAHEILENWGRDPEARDFSKIDALHDWFCADLNRIVSNQFGNRIPLAVRIQVEALKQRLLWLARIQACSRAEGWEVTEVEQEFFIPIAGTTIKARIDRIDRHRETGALRVLDYKTGRTNKPSDAHRRKISSRSSVPAHLGDAGPAFFTGRDGKGIPADYRWTNLQLPLYVRAVREKLGISPTPCYFQLGDTEANVHIAAWEDFSPEDLESASACAEWAVSQIRSGIFWPPAEKVEYDDFSDLSMGRNAMDHFSPPLQASD